MLSCQHIVGPDLGVAVRMVLLLLLALSLGGEVAKAGVSWSPEGGTLPKSSKTLRSLFVLSVNGIRTPIHPPFRGDPSAARFPVGQNTLTEQGVLMMKHIGQTLRSRYSKFLDHKTNLKTRLVTAFPTAVTEDSARHLTPNMFTYKYPPTIFTGFAEYFDKSGLVSEIPETTQCPRYACLREREKNKRYRITREQKKFYRAFSEEIGVDIESSHLFWLLYDRYQMAVLNNIEMPPWFSRLDPHRVGVTRRRRMNKMIGLNDFTYKFITDPLVKWMASLLKLDPSVFQYDKNVADGKSLAKRVHVHVTNEVPITVLGWLMFQGSFQKEFGRPFVVEVGDVLMMEVHHTKDQKGYWHEILKMFYYSPTSTDPSRRFKQLSLQEYLDSKGLRNWKIFPTGFLKLLTFDSTYTDQCALATPWYARNSWLKKYDKCKPVVKNIK